MSSLEALFVSNYEIRCSLLSSCGPKNTVMLMKAFEPRTRLTAREKKEQLGLCTLIFKDDDLIYNLYKSDIKITVICKDLDELLKIYYNSDRRSRVCIFDVIIILSKGRKVIPVYSDMVRTAFRAQTLCPITIFSEWYESSTKVNNARIKLRFLVSERETTTPFLMPLTVADIFMDTSVVPYETVSNMAITKYLQLHDDAKIWKTAKSVSSATLTSLKHGVDFVFKVTADHRADLFIPIPI